MPALDYSLVAAVYDDFCDSDRDLDFFRSLLTKRPGRVLELMAGTGRMSIPLLEGGIELTCVDTSVDMLAILRRKLIQRNLRAALLCADVCALPLECRYETVILPFNGFCELTSEQEQRYALRAVAAALADRGRFVCTTHNPRIRRRTLDGVWHEVGEFPRRSGGVVRVFLKGSFDPTGGIVRGQERIEVVDESGRASEILVPLRFSLVPASLLETLAEEAGLRLVSLYGDYDGSVYDEAESPSVIATFERTAQAR